MFRAFRLTAALGLCATLSACGKPALRTDYTVAVTFTPAALAALKAANETVILDAYYYGAPTPAMTSIANEAGQVELGEDFATAGLSAASIQIAGKGLDQEFLPGVEGGKINVVLRAYSGTDQENVLKCATVATTLTDLQAKSATVACDAA